MAKTKVIKVLAAINQEGILNDVHTETEWETIKTAKAKAKYYLSEEYMRVCESATRLGYAQVLVNGDCIADYFVSPSTGKVI